MVTNFTKIIEQVASLFVLAAIITILVLAFLFQFVLHELPCPLCLLQRVGFILMMIGFLMNLRFGFRPSHYAMILLGGLYTSFVALRQVALHVIPNTGSYGSAIFSLHLYTWAYIAAMAIVTVTTLLLGFDRQYQNQDQDQIGKRWSYVTQALFVLVTLVVLANLVSVVLECGIKTCPDNPVTYELLNTTYNSRISYSR